MAATEGAGTGDGESADPGIRLGPEAAYRCPRRIHLDHDPDADRSARRPPEPGLLLRKEARAEHRAATRARLAAVQAIVDGVRFGPADPGAGAVAGRGDVGGDVISMTPLPGAADPTRPWLWQARLAHGPRSAVVDLLVPAPPADPARSAVGYVPVLLRGHRTTDPGAAALLSPLGDPLAIRSAPGRKLRSHHGDQLALAHVHRLLDDLGLAAAPPAGGMHGARLGGVIGHGRSAMHEGLDDAAVVVWHELTDEVAAEYEERFADRLAVATAAVLRRPALAVPSRIAACRRCPWWSVCGPELEAARDVSLLVAGSDVEVLRSVGARSYDDVATMDAAVLATLPLSGIPAGEARIRARAMAAGTPLVRRTAAVDVPRADIELDVDMESYSDDGAYLWGTYLSGPGVDEIGHEPGYRAFVTWEPLAGGAAAPTFVAFWAFLSELRRLADYAGLSFAAYCYSRRAEERWLYGTPARFPGEPGMPTAAEVDEFCGSPDWVDLYAELRRLFVVPGSLRLKAVAPLAGFDWRDPEPGGENSMAWYRVATGADPGDAAAHRARILRYNEDDVLATHALRTWLTDRPDAMPTVAEIDARYGG